MTTALEPELTTYRWSSHNMAGSGSRTRQLARSSPSSRGAGPRR